MRGLVVAAALVLVPMTSPSLPAQSADEPFVVDAAGDVWVWWSLQSLAPLPGSEAADIVSMDVDETFDELILSATLVDIPDNAGPLGHSTGFDVIWGEARYWVSCGRDETSTRCGIWGATQAQLVGGFDPAANSVTVHVPKVLLAGREGIVPSRGDSLDLNVWAAAQLDVFADWAPERERKAYTLRVGDPSTGHLEMDVDRRVRVSNGGATTVLFEPSLRNLRTQEDVVDLRIAGLPEGWSGRLPTELRIPASGTAVVPTLVTMPFAHEHGGFTNFTVEATSRSDPAARATVLLGVLHTPTPQPTAHHPEIFLHPRPPNLWDGLNDVPGLRAATGWSWERAPVGMSASSEHDGERPTQTPTGMTERGPHWVIGLEPGLATGLDLVAGGVANLDVALVESISAEGTLRARLLLVRQAGSVDGARQGVPYDLEDSTLIAEAESTMSFAAREPAALSLQLPIEEGLDLIPYAPDQNLVLELELETPGARERCCSGELAPRLVAEGFVLELPLEEYHDPLPIQTVGSSRIDLVAQGPVEKDARPGLEVAYLFRVGNLGDEPAQVELAVLGTDASSARLQQAKLRVPARGASMGAIVVSVPLGASPGDALEVVVQASLGEGEAQNAYLRTLTHVRPDAAPEDTGVVLSAATDDGRDTPVPIVLVALALLVAAASRRRAGR